MAKNQTKRCSECRVTVNRPHKEGCSRPKSKKKGQKVAVR